MEITKEVLTKILCLFVFIGIVGFSEKFYRDPVFKYSLQFIEDLQKNTPNYLIFFFRMISYLGYGEFLIPISLLIFNVCTLQYTFILYNVLIGAAFLTGLLKLIFENPRPYWINSHITPMKCELDYGNPSGHAVLMFSFYLIIFHLLYDKYVKDKNIFTKISYWGASITLLINVGFSRLVIGVHSINQVMMGSCLGFAIYFGFYHILEVQNYSSKEFLEKFQEGNWYTFWFVLKYIAGAVKGILVYVFVHFKNDNYISRIEQVCPNHQEYKKFHHFDLGMTLLVFAAIGMIIGIFFLMMARNLRLKEVDEQSLCHINQWNQTSFLKTCFRIVLSILFLALVTIPFQYLGSLTKTTWLKVSIAFGVIPFLQFLTMFSILIIIFIKVGLANDEITRQHDDYVNPEEKKPLIEESKQDK